MTGRLCACLALAAMLALAAQLAAAQERGEERPAVLFVRTPGDAPLVERLRSEIAGSARMVEVAQPRGASPLGELARASGAEAAVRVDAARHLVELWFAPRAPRPEAVLEVLRDRDHGMLLLRAAEVLRARGLLTATVASRAEEVAPTAERLESARAPGGDATPAQAPGRDATPARAPGGDATPAQARLRIALAPSVALSPGGVGPLLGASLGVRLRLAQELWLTGQALLPLWSRPLQAAEGSARVWPWLLALGAELELPLAGPRLRVGAAGALVLVRMSGQAEAPLRGTSDHARAAAILASLALQWPLGTRLAIVAQALAGTTLARVRTRFVARDVAHWGQPVLMLLAGVDLAL